jgi:uncharacterized membrane protein
VRWILTLCFLLTTTANAATLRGRVIDSTGAVLPGVSVEAKGRTTVTQADGTYEIALEDGKHDVVFRLVGFASTIKRAVDVTNDAQLDVALYLSMNTDVVVTAKRTFRNS